jgi:hypothetical protein
MTIRIVLLNAFPVNAIQYELFTASFKLLTLDEFVRELVNHVVSKRTVVNYIRHESTLKLITNKLGNVKIDLKPSNELYRYSEDDIIYIISLKKPIRGQEVEVKEEDLLIHRCVIAKGVWL